MKTYEDLLKEQVISYPKYKRLMIQNGMKPKSFFNIIKFVATCIIFLSSIVGYSQSLCMLCTFDELMLINVEKHSEEKDILVYMKITDEFGFIYYFDKQTKRVLYQTVLAESKMAQTVITLFNEKYERETSTSWWFLHRGFIIKVNMEYDSKNKMYNFNFTL
jgi:hypothetical protein